MLPVLQIGPFAVPLPELLLLLGVWFGLSTAERSARRYGLNPGGLYDLIFLSLVAGVVGARLVFAARFPAAFAANPAGLLSPNPGLLDPWGGFAVGLITAIAFGQRKGFSLWPTLDAVAPSLALFVVFVGLSHLASGEAFGAPANLPWSIELWGALRHPSQVYETLLAALIWLAVLRDIGVPSSSAPGVRFLVFAGYSAAAHLFLEAFRGDSLLLPGGLRSIQLVAWLLLAVCLLGIGQLQHRKVVRER